MKNQIALLNNVEVSIHDYDPAKKGQYRCPCCGNELIAKRGNKMQHHWSHAHEVSCDYSSGGPETDLHKRTVQRVNSMNSRFFKEVIRLATGREVDGVISQAETNIEVNETFFRLDVAVFTMTGIYAFEIVNTHKSSKLKVDTFKENLIELNCCTWINLCNEFIKCGYLTTLDM